MSNGTVSAMQTRTSDIVTLILGATVLFSLAAGSGTTHRSPAGFRTAIELIGKKPARMLAPGIGREPDTMIYLPPAIDFEPAHAST